MRIVGIDLALRNSAAVALDEEYKFLGCKVITSNAKTLDNEDLLIYNRNEILTFCGNSNNLIIIIEGLAFNSPSLAKDIIAGNFWSIKLKLYENGTEYHTVPPVSWRAKVFSKEQKEELKSFKKENSGKSGLKVKEVALSCVPNNVISEFKKYLTDNKLNVKFLYDLADAYCIAKYGVILYNESK
jgi:hypothetical protein